MSKDAPITPDAGFARNEELRRRLDELQAEGEQIAAELGIEKPNPRAFRIIRDDSIRPMDPQLQIKHPDANYVYSWVFRNQFNKPGIEMVPVYESRGWEVVKSDMPEAKGMKIGPDNTVVNADCLLMRMRRDVKLLAEQRDWETRRARQEGHAANLKELGARHGINVTEEVPESVRGQMESASQSAMLRRATPARQQRQFARQMGVNQLDAQIRAGTVPGMPVPRG